MRGIASLGVSDDDGETRGREASAKKLLGLCGGRWEGGAVGGDRSASARALGRKRFLWAGRTIPPPGAKGLDCVHVRPLSSLSQIPLARHQAHREISQ